MKKFYIDISELDYSVIIQVKKLREERKISQRKLSRLMGLSDSFVGKVESLGQPDKYSIRHLSLIAKALKLENYLELLPSTITSNDIIRITYTKVAKTKKDGSVSNQQFEEKILAIEPLNNTNI